MKLFLTAMLTILSVTTTSVSFANEEGEAETWCIIKNLNSAQDCVKRAAVTMGTGNSENAVFVATNKKSKEMLSQIMNASGGKDSKAALKALTSDYVAVVVQNHDENMLYYYAFSKGRVNLKPLSRPINTADLSYDVCRENNAYPKFMKTVRGMLLGLSLNDTVAGTVYLEDFICDE